MAVLHREPKSQRDRREIMAIRNRGRRGRGPLPYDPQGYSLGPIGVIASQVAVVFSIVWGLGAIKELFLPTTLGLFPLLLMAGVLLIAPRTSVLQLPVSVSISLVLLIHLASITWTIDSLATSVALRGLIPSILTLILAAGLLTLDQFTDALLWAFRLVILITFAALVAVPSSRTHVSTDIYLPDYPGWHGFFIHKNEMAPVLVFAVITVLTFERNPILRWGTLGLLGILLAGSTSATGLSAAFFAGVVWYWFRIYRAQDDEKSSTLFITVTVLGFLGMLVGVLASVATITSAYGKDTSFSGRTDIWEAAVHFLGQRPFFGYGMGALFWVEPINRETVEIRNRVGFPAAHAHNGVLDLALQVGLIGIIFFGGLWFTTTRKSWAALQRQPELAIWALTFIAANLLMAFSENVFSYVWWGVFAAINTLMMRRPEALGTPRRLLYTTDRDFYR